MSIREVLCATCHETRPVNAFGRCCVCGNLIAPADLESPSRLVWHLREHVTLYAALTTFALAALAVAAPASLGPWVARPTDRRAADQAPAGVGGSSFTLWLRGRYA